jgi:hypothetical protein
MTNLSAAIGATALQPWSPVHVRGRRDGDGIHISWIRRTRRGGDSWDVAEVPLVEDSEAYRVEILSGESVVRTLESNSPSTLYVSADEVADFGTPQTELTVRIAQLSAVVGAGQPRVKTISF